MHITAKNAALMVCYKIGYIISIFSVLNPGMSFWTRSLEQGVDICGEWSNEW